MLAFDIETDGLLTDIEKVQCINLIDRATGNVERYNDAGTGTGTIRDGLRRLSEADEIVGHNVIDFDIPALQKVYPEFEVAGRVLDTKVLSRLIHTNLKDKDIAAIRKGRLPQDFNKIAARGRGGAIGSHSLKPWGVRLGFPKDDFDPADYINPVTCKPHTWKTVPFSQEMDDYCVQDVRVTVKLLETLEAHNYSADAIQLEHDVATIISRQQRYGWLFDSVAANALVKTLLIRKLELEEQCRSVFDPWLAPDGKPFTPKRDNKTRGYVAGAPFCKIKLVTFNPGSRDHVADRLQKLYGWAPREFTDTGKPKVDETVLAALNYPRVKEIAEYFLVSKRLGQLAEGKEALLNNVREDGRIHGQLETNGAVTGRMTHFKPNVAQTPKVGVPYGREFRALFIAAPGKLLVGCDAEGLELRMLGHFMAKWDGGAFIKTVVDGRKEDGTDVHTVNQKIAGFNKRDNAKTLIYAFLYGAGDYKLGTVALDDFDEAKRTRFNTKYPSGHAGRDAAIARLGRSLRERFLEGLPALKKLIDAVKKAARRGYLVGLDGRLLHIRSIHAALNTLLQSAGALVMKKALVILDRDLQARGLKPGINYEFVANVHDEFQLEVDEQHADEVGQAAAAAIKAAGAAFALRCELSGAYATGRNWAETH